MDDPGNRGAAPVHPRGGLKIGSGAASRNYSYPKAPVASSPLIAFDPWDASAVTRGRDVAGFTLERDGKVLALDADHRLIAAFAKQRDATAAVLAGRAGA